jgi:hypothetical protein
MLRRDYPARGYYDWPPPPLSAVRARWLLWLALGSISVAVLALVAFVLDHDNPPSARPVRALLADPWPGGGAAGAAELAPPLRGLAAGPRRR